MWIFYIIILVLCYTYMYIQSFSETGIGRYQTFINGKLWADYPMKTMSTGYRSIDEYILQDS